MFRGGCTNLHSYQQCGKVPFSPQLLQHLVLAGFFVMFILTGVRRHHTVVLICISLIISSVERLVIFLLAVCMSSVEKCLSRSSAQVLIGLLVCFVIELHELFVYFGN